MKYSGYTDFCRACFDEKGWEVSLYDSMPKPGTLTWWWFWYGSMKSIPGIPGGR